MTSADPEPLDNRGSGGGGVAPEVLVEGGWGGRGGADLGEQDGHGAGGRDDVGGGAGAAGPAVAAGDQPRAPARGGGGRAGGGGVWGGRRRLTRRSPSLARRGTAGPGGAGRR